MHCTMDSRRMVLLLFAALLSSSLQLQAQGRELLSPSSFSPRDDDDIKLVTSRRSSNSTMVASDFVHAGACKYHLEVKTGDVSYAGTDSKITFGLFGPDWMGFTITVDSTGGFHGNLFERGRLDAVDVESDNCLNPCALVLISNGSGPYPDWYVEWVRVTVSGYVCDQRTFYVNDWIGPYSARGLKIKINDCTGAA